MIPLPGQSVESCLFQGERVRAERLPRGVHRLVLARPDRRNAFDALMVREVSQILEALVHLPAADLRVLLLDGEGDWFCAGADLGYMRSQAEGSLEENLKDARILGRMFHRLAGFPVPVVALVQGAAIGGGLGLAACADLVLADAGAVFATSEVRLGILPAVISPYILRRLSPSWAAPLMLSGARIPAQEAHRIGLVHQVVGEPGAWPAAVQGTLQDLLAGGPEAVRQTKLLLLDLAPLPDPALQERTAQAIARLRVSPEGQAGLKAFFDKAPAPWTQEQP